MATTTETALQVKLLEPTLTVNDVKKSVTFFEGLGFMRFYLNTSQNIDQLAGRAKKAGIALDSPPHDMEMGGRGFDVTEPSGFKLTIMSL